MKKQDFATYQSPFTWRYGSDDMRHIWSEENKFQTMRRIWVELASAQKDLGLVSQEELDDLKKNQNEIDIERILEIEKETKHDIVAAIKEYAEKTKVDGGKKIHLGATSMDIVDNTDSIRIKEALIIIESKLKELLKSFAGQIEKYTDTPCMGYTHLQPAEPTTIGYRLALYAQDFLEDLKLLQFVKANYKAKGFKGAVGTQASYTSLLSKSQTEEMEQKVMDKLGIEPVLIANQVGPEKSRSLRRSTSFINCTIIKQIRLRCPTHAISGNWRMAGTIWRKTSRIKCNAIQTQPANSRTNLFAGKICRKSFQKRLGQCTLSHC